MFGIKQINHQLLRIAFIMMLFLIAGVLFGCKHNDKDLRNANGFESVEIEAEDIVDID